MPFDKPYWERVEDTLKANGETQEQAIVRKIKEHQAKHEEILTGQRYYEHCNDIEFQDYKRDLDGNIDVTKADWRMNTNYHQMLVDQKVSYLVGNAINLRSAKEDELQKIQEVMDYRFDKKLVSILTSASNKGVEYVHPYVDDEGKMRFFRVPAEQGIAIWENTEEEDMQAFIRYYKEDDVTKVEYWTKEDVTYYVMEHDTLIPDYYHGEDHVQTHMEGMSWGRVPFVPFRNNTQEVSDIWMYKRIIDALDKTLSDTQNNFDESLELIYILRGYEGQDLETFMKGMKHYKAINVDSEGGVDTIRMEVPVEARLAWAKELRRYIIEYGQGVDFQQDKLGNNASGVAIEFMFANLRNKVEKLKREVDDALKGLLFYVIEYTGAGIVPDDVEIKFNFNDIKDPSRDMDIISKSVGQGIVSNETLTANHPFVDDVSLEMERLEQESMDFNTDIPDLEGEEDGKAEDTQN